jgi:enoyl-CoA hydratase/carnithine racemase
MPTLATHLVESTLVVTIDAPDKPVNTLGVDLVGEFEGVFARVEADPLIQGVVLVSGTGGAAVVDGGGGGACSAVFMSATARERRSTLLSSSRMRASREMPGGFDRYSTGSPLPRKCTP